MRATDGARRLSGMGNTAEALMTDIDISSGN